ncbi:YXWGXW repeat-containing protein [Solimonas aquatica]|nr:YXWGXW repeat-containing protein [Solimonas aquatica]
MLIRLRFVPLLLAILLSPLSARADLQISVNFAPPELPVYDQPYCPGPGYLWVPGYWAYDPDYGEYYWVPGTWARPPRPGLLWTPGYWAWNEFAYVWYPGYWSTQVGFYGGINYGYGYPGSGFYGGYWRGNQYYYNRSVSRVDTRRIPYFYQRNVVNNITINRISFNGGDDGVRYRPNEREREYGRLSRFAPTSPQLQHIQSARQDRQLFARENGGRPPIAATLRPGAFGPRDIVPSREAWRGGDPRRDERDQDRRDVQQRWQQQQERQDAWQRDGDRRRAEQQREERDQLQQQLLRRNDEQQRREAQDRQNWARQQQQAQQREERMRDQQRQQQDEQRRQMQQRQNDFEQQQRQIQQQREYQQREAQQQQERARREMQQQQERQQREMQQQQQQQRQQREIPQRQQQGEQQRRPDAPAWTRMMQRGQDDSRN